MWRTLRRTRLSVRLAVLTALLAALVTAATFVALSVQVRNSTRALFAKELERNGRTLVSLQRENRRHQVLTAALLSESPTLRAALGTNVLEQLSDSAQRRSLTNTVENELERLGRGDLPGEALLVTDERGRVFASYARGAPGSMRGTDLSTLPAVRNALDPTLQATSDAPYLSGLEMGDEFYSVGAAPLIVNGFTTGTIVLGAKVDSTVVEALRRDFNGEVVISAGPKIISSSLPLAEARAAAAAPAQEEPLSIGREEYLVAAIPLGKTQRNTDLRITLLQPLTPAVQSLTSALLPEFVLYGTLGVLLAALGAAVLARSLLLPLGRFIAFMSQGAEQERVDRAFDAEDASQELRALNESFNHLMTSLGKKRSELERRGEELAAANVVLTEEITQRERVEHALRESEAQLRQSQKLEAIGTLAGGIAHDFNNMLTVISGFTQLAISALGKQHPVSEDLKQVSDAANSAAGLTHQLLAFSRKQVLQPRVLDLEQVVRGMESMLRRLIGSHIQLQVTHVGDSARIKADPGQLEQVLLNLAVNARDAMVHGGILTIATEHLLSKTGPGSVLLHVRDTGSGMTPQVRERIFEPFFTTKDVGKGTGLGLATVYGIVTQSGGRVEVESWLGTGTNFTIVFPSASEHPAAGLSADGGTELPRGTETILLVDDEDAVRAFAKRTLEVCGYTVLDAHSGVEALTLARASAHIDVLLTDIVMPQLSGPQLVERYLAKHPAPCVIYMTGYMDDDTKRVELEEDVVLLRKPFSPFDLARLVRTTIDMRCAAVLSDER